MLRACDPSRIATTAAPIPEAWLREDVDRGPEPLHMVECGCVRCLGFKKAVELLACRAAVARVAEIHSPHTIYDECVDHTHKPGEPGTREIDDVGIVCSKAVMYVVCAVCCLDNAGEHTEECASAHDHSEGKPICATVAAIEEIAVAESRERIASFKAALA